jgi:hypothetical protein
MLKIVGTVCVVERYSYSKFSAKTIISDDLVEKNILSGHNNISTLKILNLTKKSNLAEPESCILADLL